MDSFKQKSLGELMVFGFDGTEMTVAIRRFIHEQQLGAVILFARNMKSSQQIRRLTHELQSEARRAGHVQPLLIATDQENGEVHRLPEDEVCLPGPMLIGAAGRPDYACDVGRMTARQLLDVGINWNLAPVADVSNNPDNTLIGCRAFSGHPQQAGIFAAQFMCGSQYEHVAATLKHFPGHGDTVIDSHLDLPVIAHSLEHLEAVELVPFRMCIAAGAQVVMLAHVYFPALEKAPNIPASLSRSVVTGLLRARLGFRGIVMTDCLEMDAVSRRFGTAEGAVMALQAGVDMMLVSHTQTRQLETVQRVEQAVKEGALDDEQLRASVQRVRQLKKKNLNWNDALAPECITASEKKEQHQRATTMFMQGVTLVRQPPRGLPFHDSPHLLFIDASVAHMSGVVDVHEKENAFLSLAHRLAPEAARLRCASADFSAQLANAEKRKLQAAVVFVSTLSTEAAQLTWISELARTTDVLVIATQSPSVIRHLPIRVGCICTYEQSKPALTCAVLTAIGRLTLSGKLPVSL